jgi:hypothetical protein
MLRDSLRSASRLAAWAGLSDQEENDPALDREIPQDNKASLPHREMDDLETDPP